MQKGILSHPLSDYQDEVHDPLVDRAHRTPNGNRILSHVCDSRDIVG